DDKGRGGMYVTSLSRASIREAMQARRFFAARGKGIRFDATANGARMGSTLRHRRGQVRFLVDLDRGPAWYGKVVNIQVLMTGTPLPRLVDAFEHPLPSGPRERLFDDPRGLRIAEREPRAVPVLPHRPDGPRPRPDGGGVAAEKYPVRAVVPFGGSGG
ncbi:MAG: hypothetical protein KY469_22445, partial [Actinobacteria bacterium]|nr:hypothetical protein [Actinomycetota bacterium]